LKVIRPQFATLGAMVLSGTIGRPANHKNSRLRIRCWQQRLWNNTGRLTNELKGIELRSRGEKRRTVWMQ